MRILKKVLVAFIILLGTIAIVAAQAQCPSIVQNAVMVMDNECTLTGRNQMCYGNGEIVVLAQPGAVIAKFNAPGDLEEVANVQSLTLSELDAALGDWGVALMQVQADLPETLPGQNVTILLFGDVEVTNAGDAMEAFYFRSGIGASGCAETPNGIMIQTPKGQGMVNLTVNDVQIALGSTAFLTAEPEELMTFALLEGESTFGEGDDEIALEGGEFTTVELDENLSAVGVPSEAQVIDGNLELPELPILLLPRDPFSDEETTDDGDSNTAAGDGLIIPLSGTWTYTRGDVITTAACPPQLGTMMETNIPITMTDTVEFADTPFDLEAFLTQNAGEAFPGIGEFISPEPNVYHWTFSQEGALFIYEIVLVSELEIEGRIHFDMSAAGFACEITFPFTLEYTG